MQSEAIAPTVHIGWMSGRSRPNRSDTALELVGFRCSLHPDTSFAVPAIKGAREALEVKAPAASAMP